MIIEKKSSIGINKFSDRESNNRAIDEDIQNLVTLSQSRIRFGIPTSGRNGENISGQFIQYTSNAIINTEDTIAHTIGSIPVGYLILWQDKAGSFYQSPTSGTDWTNSAIYLKCSVASITVLLFLIK